MTADTHATRKKGGFLDTVIVFAEALLIAIVIRTFLVQPFNIPSGSMLPNLLIGDFLFVTKYSYGYSRHSFPFSFPPFEGRVWSAPPARGDVAVFKLPADNETDYIKRVIGTPGDRIQMIRGVLHINGRPVERTFLGNAQVADRFGGSMMLPQYRETLPDGRSYTIMQRSFEGFANNTNVYVVPQGHYFMMGDNRDDSEDSRFLDKVGYVPFENLVGRAAFLFFSIREGERAWAFWRWPWSVRWERLGSAIP